MGVPILEQVEIERGNFDDEHMGCIENEIEQWLVPVGYRPEPGDRIQMTGRWIIDCGHDNWAAEIHPYESVVSTHLELPAGASPFAATAVSAVVVTGAWPGGTLEIDLWPPPRPDADWMLRYERDAGGIQQELQVAERLEPRANPNHLHLTIISDKPREVLVTKSDNDVYYNIVRRLACRYRLSWAVRVHQADIAARQPDRTQ